MPVTVSASVTSDRKMPGPISDWPRPRSDPISSPIATTASAMAATPAQLSCHQPAKMPDGGQTADQQHHAHGHPADHAALPGAGGAVRSGGGFGQIPGERRDAQRIPGRRRRVRRRRCAAVVLAQVDLAGRRRTGVRSSSQNAGLLERAECRESDDLRLVRPPGGRPTTAAGRPTARPARPRTRPSGRSAVGPLGRTCCVDLTGDRPQPPLAPARSASHHDGDDADDDQRPERQTPGEHRQDRDDRDDGQTDGEHRRGRRAAPAEQRLGGATPRRRRPAAAASPGRTAADRIRRRSSGRRTRPGSAPGRRRRLDRGRRRRRRSCGRSPIGGGAESTSLRRGRPVPAVRSCCVSLMA